MSTILDALKKVEEEQNSTSGPAQQRQLDALQPNFGRRRLPGAKLIKWCAMGFVLCVLVGLTIYLFQQDRDTPSQPIPERAQAAQPRPALTREPPPPKVAAPAKRAPVDPPRIQRSLIDEQQPTTDRSTLAVAQPAPSKRPTQRPEPVSRADIRNRTSQRQNQTPSPPPAPSPARQPQPSPVEAQPAPQHQQLPQPPAPARRSTPPPKSPAPKESTPFSNVGRLTDNSLKVQAIAWSQSPEERMAVINSQIVREGSTVDDYDVVAIQPDEVIVRTGGQMFKAIFGRP